MPRVNSLEVVALGLLLTLALYGTFVASLAISGRRSEAAALVRFIPDCVVLLRRLIAALGLRFALRSGGRDALQRHWPGPEETLSVVSRLAFGQR